MAVVALRPVKDGDLNALLEQMRDPAGVRMAAFTPEDPHDRNAFDAHMARVRSSPDITLRAVICGGRLAGSIASFPAGGQTEVTYWIDRAAWGKGIAARALALVSENARRSSAPIVACPRRRRVPLQSGPSVTSTPCRLGSYRSAAPQEAGLTVTEGDK